MSTDDARMMQIPCSGGEQIRRRSTNEGVSRRARGVHRVLDGEMQGGMHAEIGKCGCLLAEIPPRVMLPQNGRGQLPVRPGCGLEVIHIRA